LPFALLPLGPLDALPLDARTLGPLHTLPLDLLPFGPLDALPLDTGPFRALNTLPLDLRSLSPLDSLPLNPLWSFRTLHTLPLSPLRPFGPLDSLPLRTLWPLCLAFALARLRALAAITAVALGVGRAGQREAGDAGNQEKLGTHGRLLAQTEPLHINEPDYEMGLCRG
jgi:hypothetical protein